MRKITILLPLLYVFLTASAIFASDIFNHSVKCGTPEAIQHFNSVVGKRALYQRQDFESDAVSAEGHFRVHYNTTGYHKPVLTDNDTNGIPDWIDSTLVYMEYAWNLQINELGYDMPNPDDGRGGGDEIDVYIWNFGTGSYGVTEPEKNEDGSITSYIMIDNDYSESQYATKGYAALRVTTAHEFFHTIHFHYVPDFYMQLSWWMEQTAVWMEDRAWDDVNDYLAYLRFFFGGTYDNQKYPLYSKNTALDYNYTNFRYGAAIWAMFLAKRYGDDQIKTIWETFRNSSYPRIADFEQAMREGTSNETGLADAFQEFAIWNYFTKDNANTDDFYSDADLFQVGVTSDFFYDNNPSEGSSGITNLTSRYIELLFVGDWNQHDRLNVSVTKNDGGSYKNSVVFFNDPYDYSIQSVPETGGQLTLTKQWDKAVLIISCTTTFSKEYTIDFTAEMEHSTDVQSHPLYAFDLHGAYPNPFNPTTTISFSLAKPGNTTVNVFNTAGQKIDELFTGYLPAGEKQIVWKPSGLSGGLYFIMVTTPHGAKTTKVLLLK